MTGHTPTTAEVRDYFTHGQFSDVPEPEGVARFNRWLAKHDAELAAATRTAALEEAAELLRREAYRVAHLKILKPEYRQALVDTFYEASRVVMRAESAGPR